MMRSIFRSIFVIVAFCWGAIGAAADSPSLDASLKQANQLIAVERLEDALTLLKSIDVQTPGASARVDTLLGKIFLRLHKPSQAADFFENAILSSMDDAEAYLGLASAELELGRMVKSRRHADNAIRSNPDLVEAHLVLAKIDDLTGRSSKARQRFVSLMKNQPDSEPVAVSYATFLAQRNDMNAATVLLSGFLARHPYAAEAGDLLGQLYWQQNIRGRALQTRATAASAFQAMGNDFRAEAIRSWLVANDPGGNYYRQLRPGKFSAPAPVVKPAPRPVPKLQPAPKSVPVRPVKQARLPAPPRPAAKIPHVLKRPEPLPLRPGAMLNTGSGFIIDGGRYVITNRHVIANTGNVAVRSGTGEVRKARVLRVSSDDDLAILELARPFPESYAIPYDQMGDAGTGRSAVVMGYPLTGLIGWRQPSLTEGIVSKASGLGDNPKTFQISAKMNKGNSGGPILDYRGRLIGIAVAKLNTTKIYEKKGSLPEDVNIAIKASRLLNFLKQPVNEGPPPLPETSLEELYQVMLAKVVMVAAETN